MIQVTIDLTAEGTKGFGQLIERRGITADQLAQTAIEYYLSHEREEAHRRAMEMARTAGCRGLFEDYMAVFPNCVMDQLR